MADGACFEVQVKPRRHKLGPVSQLVFHGINKSGSLALSDVMRQAYQKQKRLDEFYSHYRGEPADLAELVRIIRSGAPGFFVAHNLYGRLELPHQSRVLLTQFRHPLPRVVSCYQWLLGKHTRAKGPDVPFASLEQFVREGGGKRVSQITQFGIGFAVDDATRRQLIRGCSTLEIRERAQAAIASDVGLIGIAEFFEETIFLVAHVCGLPQVPVWRRDTRNAGRPLVDELPSTTVSLIQEVYEDDFKLYRWVRERFFDQLADVAFGPELDAYRRACVGEYKDRLV